MDVVVERVGISNVPLICVVKHPSIAKFLTILTGFSSLELVSIILSQETLCSFPKVCTPYILIIVLNLGQCNHVQLWGSVSNYML
jgi:hypothetical protein